MLMIISHGVFEAQARPGRAGARKHQFLGWRARLVNSVLNEEDSFIPFVRPYLYSRGEKRASPFLIAPRRSSGAIRGACDL